MGKKLVFVVLLLLPCLVAAAKAEETTPANWSGKYAPCNHHSELTNPGHMNLAVRFSTADPLLAQEFTRAMNFWSAILDSEWRETTSDDCALQLVDGSPALFDFCLCLSAKSQFPDRADFQGWIAFNPRMKLTRDQMFLDSVHEIGHLLGLRHNPSISSVMYFFGANKSTALDGADLRALAKQHQLRDGLPKSGIRDVRAVLSGSTGGRRPGEGALRWFSGPRPGRASGQEAKSR